MVNEMCTQGKCLGFRTASHLPGGRCKEAYYDKVILGDCIETMKGMPSQIIDLIVTDPPYQLKLKPENTAGWKERVGGGMRDRITAEWNDMDDEEYRKLIKECLKQCHGILKNNGSIYFFCPDLHMDWILPEFTKYFKLRNILVWYKKRFTPTLATVKYSPAQEKILFGAKGNNYLKDANVSDVMVFDSPPSHWHPCPRPIGLIKKMVEQSSKPGDLVMDCFTGSGTHLMAAKELGRHYFGTEKNPDYYIKILEALKGTNVKTVTEQKKLI